MGRCNTKCSQPLFPSRLVEPLALEKPLPALTSLRRGTERVPRPWFPAHFTPLFCTAYLSWLLNNQLQNALCPLAHPVLFAGESRSCMLKMHQDKRRARAGTWLTWGRHQHKEFFTPSYTWTHASSVPSSAATFGSSFLYSQVCCWSPIEGSTCSWTPDMYPVGTCWAPQSSVYFPQPRRHDRCQSCRQRPPKAGREIWRKLTLCLALPHLWSQSPALLENTIYCLHLADRKNKKGWDVLLSKPRKWEAEIRIQTGMLKIHILSMVRV